PRQKPAEPDKAELSAKPAAPSAPPADEARLGALRAELEDAMLEGGYSVSGLYAEFGKRVGIDPARGLPNLDQLDERQVTGLLEALEGRGVKPGDPATEGLFTEAD